jgi:spore maturation protein CgeB
MHSTYIVGTPIHNYTKILSNAFNDNGIATDFEVYKKPNAFFKSIPILSTWSKIYFEKRGGDEKYRHISSNSLDFDLLILFGVSYISREKLLYLKQKRNFKILLWFVDSINAYKQFYDVIDIADFIICYNQSDAIKLKEKGLNSLFLPLAYDSETYCYRERKFEYDIYFIGTLKSRIKYFEQYLTMLNAPNLRIRIDGKLSLLFRLKNRKKYPLFFKCHTNKRLTHSEICDVYNRSKICLNLQPEQAVSGFSIRTFEICGAGGFQLTDGNYSLLNEIYSIGKDIEYFSNIEDLVKKTHNYLDEKNDHKRKEIARNGYINAVSNHSFLKRVQEVIAFIKYN